MKSKPITKVTLIEDICTLRKEDEDEMRKLINNKYPTTGVTLTKIYVLHTEDNPPMIIDVSYANSISLGYMLDTARPHFTVPKLGGSL